MAAISLFWDTNMAAMTSCENTQSFYQIHPWKRLTRAVRVSRAGLEPNAPHTGEKSPRSARNNEGVKAIPFLGAQTLHI